MSGEQRTPQAGEVWVDEDGRECTILWGAETSGGRVAHWFEDNGSRWVDDCLLGYFLNHYTPKPEPTPGPDELWVAYDEPGDYAFNAYRTHEDAAAYEHDDTPIVRYVKADPQ